VEKGKESEPLIKDKGRSSAPFQVTQFPPWWVLVNPIAWLLWILDFLIWLVTIVLPALTVSWWLKRLCNAESVEGEDEEDVRRGSKALWEDGFLLSPFTDDDGNSEEATAWEIFEFAVKTFPKNDFLGTREYLGEHLPEGQRFTLKVFGETTWQSYAQVQKKVLALGAGFRSLGMVPVPVGVDIQSIPGPHTILLFEETSADWLTTLFGAFSQALTVATSYATLGIPAVVEALTETNAPVLVCNRKSVEKMLQSAPPSLRFIVYTNHNVSPEDRGKPVGGKGSVQVMSLEELIDRGQQQLQQFPGAAPQASSVAVIMYTSGSTGKPKGVMIPHRAIAAASGALQATVKPKDGEEMYLAYLPAAHILEMAAEIAMVASGAALGFADPRTLSSKGAVRQLEDGELNLTPGYPNPPGAIQEFRPTVMAAVPIIWDTLKKGAEEQISKKGVVVQFLFQVAFSAQHYATKTGRTCPLFNLLVFRTLHQMLGGRLNLAVTGGGPISSEVQSFVRTAFGCNLVQGYALTETCACGTVQDKEDPDDGVVGPPLPCVEIKLRSCDGKEEPMDREGHPYLADDETHINDEPCQGRGEVCIRGPAVSLGYYKQPDKTAEVFMADGWFRTGDIGLWDSRGRLKLVDRLKNLVKLMGGEYIAIESMEKEYQTSVYVNSVNGGVLCIGDGSMRKPAALVQANLAEIKSWARSKGIEADDAENLCRDKSVQKEVLRSLTACAKGKLGANEIIGACRLIPGTGSLGEASCTSPWTPENGCRTASNKLERRTIAKVFEAQIEEMKKECQ